MKIINGRTALNPQKKFTVELTLAEIAAIEVCLGQFENYEVVDFVELAHGSVLADEIDDAQLAAKMARDFEDLLNDET